MKPAVGQRRLTAALLLCRCHMHPSKCLPRSKDCAIDCPSDSDMDLIMHDGVRGNFSHFIFCHTGVYLVALNSKFRNRTCGPCCMSTRPTTLSRKPPSLSAKCSRTCRASLKRICKQAGRTLTVTEGNGSAWHSSKGSERPSFRRGRRRTTCSLYRKWGDACVYYDNNMCLTLTANNGWKPVHSALH